MSQRQSGDWDFLFSRKSRLFEIVTYVPEIKHPYPSGKVRRQRSRLPTPSRPFPSSDATKFLGHLSQIVWAHTVDILLLLHKRQPIRYTVPPNYFTSSLAVHSSVELMFIRRLR